MMYAKDHDDLLARAGGKDTKWGVSLKNWAAASRQAAFDLDPNGTGGTATVSSSLFLLARFMYLDVTARTFLCKADKGVKEFTPAAYGLRGRELTELWDFGPDPAKHCSYAYQMVYSQYTLVMRFESLTGAFAMAADRNPWTNKRTAKSFSRFEPDLRPFSGSPDHARLGNAVAHDREGQNVLFLDTHVSYEKRAYCGQEDDNIYTSWDGADKARGKPPKLGSQPAGEKDSLLVNDPPVPRR